MRYVTQYIYSQRINKTNDAAAAAAFIQYQEHTLKIAAEQRNISHIVSHCFPSRMISSLGQQHTSANVIKMIRIIWLLMQ